MILQIEEFEFYGDLATQIDEGQVKIINIDLLRQHLAAAYGFLRNCPAALYVNFHGETYLQWDGELFRNASVEATLWLGSMDTVEALSIVLEDHRGQQYSYSFEFSELSTGGNDG